MRETVGVRKLLETRRKRLSDRANGKDGFVGGGVGVTILAWLKECRLFFLRRRKTLLLPENSTFFSCANVATERTIDGMSTNLPLDLPLADFFS